MILFSLFVAFAYIGIFFFFYVTLPLFFAQPRSSLVAGPLLRAVMGIFIITFSLLLMSLSFDDPWWANRLQHALGGGFAAFIAYAYAVQLSGVRVSVMQYYVLGMLLVIALGVANELLESVVQQYFGIVMAGSIADTWLDLWSNTIGIGLAMIVARVLSKPL